MKSLYLLAALLLLFLAGCGNKSQFIIKSEPAGADIFIDGKPMGKTPSTVQIPFAENCQLVMEKKIISLRMKGYKEIKEVLCYQGDDSKTLSFQLEPDQSGN